MPNIVSELWGRVHFRPELKTPLLSLVTFVLLALAGLSSQWQLLEKKGFDLLSVHTAPMQSTLPITIIGIDEPSFAEIGLRWPWPRGLHAELVDRLSEAGAAVVAFDLIMDVASTPDQDSQLADAIRRAGNVVLAADWVFQETTYARQWLRVDPLRDFTQAGAIGGLATMTLDGDMIIRQLPDNRDAFWRVILDKFNQTRPGMLPPVRLPKPPMIRYLGPDHTFPYVSYYQALDPEKFLPKEFFRDQIVLVGRDTKASPDAGAAQADTFSTPFTASTRWLTPGVELHASILENVLTGITLTQAHPAAKYALLAISILLSALGMWRWRPVLSALLGLVLMMAVVGLDWWLFRYRNIWLPAGAPLVGIVLMYVGQGGMAFLAEQQRKRQIKQAFEHYVPPQVVAEMIAHPEKLKLGGQKREVTILFTDLKGFTSISEQMNPEDVSRLLNRHLTEMTRIILRHNGTVDKFIGDAIMAFWGAPLDDPKHADHACQAAIEMQAAMAAMRESLATEGLPPLYMRIGIHSGSAIVGNMGSDDRFDYSAIGDTVNLASRLEGVNKLYGTDILLSEFTVSMLERCEHLRKVDVVIVKGKLTPVGIYTICQDNELITLSRHAIDTFQASQWDQSEELWKKIHEIFPQDKIAEIYLQRISELRAAPPSSDWSGAVALEKM
ncbi:MAG: adenylate/guanylate cyclase domain-containing protein [Sulfuricella denitrificans]|nr:adenylate/guanylate cyclase domain-containing protein [Sulfuricella denitrificans]